MGKDVIPGLDERHLRNGSQVILVASGERFLNGFPQIISHLTREKGNRGALLSTIWSANALSRRISLSKLPKGSLRIIDTVSLSMGSKITAKGNFTLLPSPVPLESILVELEKMIRSKGNGINFFILDSLSFLGKYYTKGQLGEFFHYVLNRMLEEEVTVIIMIQDHDREDPTLNLLESIMDRIVYLDEGGDEQ